MLKGGPTVGWPSHAFAVGAHDANATYSAKNVAEARILNIEISEGGTLMVRVAGPSAKPPHNPHK
jgi:hypothetical protein